MELSEHVIKAIKDYGQEDSNSALMHSCFAIEATARNLFRREDVGKKEYKDVIDQYLWILEPMMGSGVNLQETIWYNVEVDNGHGKIITDPNFSDIIYHIFRCSHAHAKSVSKNYELLAPENGKLFWQVGGGLIRMPTCIVPALLAISVFSRANADISTSGDYFLSLASEKFPIKDWWGREDDFHSFLSQRLPNPTRVTLDGLKIFRPTAQDKYFNVEIIPPSLS